MINNSLDPQTLNDPIIDYLAHVNIPYTVINQELIQTNPIPLSSILNNISSSFENDFVIYYKEYMPENILLELHHYIRNTASNMCKIFLICSASIGIKRYYDEYCRLNNSRGFNIIELPGAFWLEAYLYNTPYETLPKKTNIKSLFSFYGGCQPEHKKTDRTILSLFSAQYSDIAHVETKYNPTTWNEINDFLEYLTYFCDTKIINYYENLYKKFTNNKQFIIPFLINSNELWGQEQFSRTGYQWSIDSVSFFSLIRETDNTFNNYYTCTEKTFRCLFNGQAPIFTHGRDIVLNDFEDLGFQINKSLINYDYLKEENLVFKLQRLQQELDRLRTISFDNWNSLWLDNYEMFKYNSDYLRHDYKNAIIYPRLDNYFK